MSIDLLFLTVAIVGVGFVPALAVSRDIPIAFTLSGAASLVMGGIGAMICAALRSPLLVGVVPVVIACNAIAAWWLLRTRRLHDPVVRAERRLAVSLDSVFVVVALFVPALVLFAYKAAPPMGWDPRSIFWFHASWFEQGGAVVEESIKNPVFAFSHPDYPPGAPGVIATFWKLTGGRDLVLALDITLVLTAQALGGLAWLLIDRRRTTISMVLGTLFVVSTPALAAEVASEGYFDMLCAVLLVSAVVASRSLPHPTGPIVGAAFLMAASLTKGEGLFLGVFIAIVLVACARRARRVTAILSALAFLPALAWLVLVRTIDAGAGDVAPGGLVRLGLLRSREWHRFREALPEVMGQVRDYFLVALVVVIVAGVALAVESSRVSIALPALMLGLGILLVVLLASIYAAGSPDLGWWLSTSVRRVTTASNLLFLGVVVRILLVGPERNRVGDTVVGEADGSATPGAFRLRVGSREKAVDVEASTRRRRRSEIGYCARSRRPFSFSAGDSTRCRESAPSTIEPASAATTYEKSPNRLTNANARRWPNVTAP